MTVFSTLQILRYLVLGLFFISVVPLSLQLSELKKSLSAVQSEVQEALQRASTALNNEQQARRDCQEQVCLWCLPILARVSKIPVSFQLNSKLNLLLRDCWRREKCWESTFSVFGAAAY